MSKQSAQDHCVADFAAVTGSCSHCRTSLGKTSGCKQLAHHCCPQHGSEALNHNLESQAMMPTTAPLSQLWKKYIFKRKDTPNLPHICLQETAFAPKFCYWWKGAILLLHMCILIVWMLLETVLCYCHIIIQVKKLEIFLQELLIYIMNQRKCTWVVKIKTRPGSSVLFVLRVENWINVLDSDIFLYILWLLLYRFN